MTGRGGRGKLGRALFTAVKDVSSDANDNQIAQKPVFLALKL